MYPEEPSQIFTERPLVYAGFWERFAAVLIDGVILWAITSLLGLKAPTSFSSYFGTYQLVNIIIYWLYEVLQISGSKRATLGKRVMNIQVVGQSGERITFLQATGRHFGQYLSFFILFIGYLMMLWSDRRQTLHDKLANTYVIKDQPRF
jgi:uncharacterized RDD family membrane protein YckC